MYSCIDIPDATPRWSGWCVNLPISHGTQTIQPQWISGMPNYITIIQASPTISIYIINISKQNTGSHFNLHSSRFTRWMTQNRRISTSDTSNWVSSELTAKPHMFNMFFFFNTHQNTKKRQYIGNLSVASVGQTQPDTISHLKPHRPNATSPSESDHMKLAVRIYWSLHTKLARVHHDLPNPKHRQSWIESSTTHTQDEHHRAGGRED